MYTSLDQHQRQDQLCCHGDGESEAAPAADDDGALRSRQSTRAAVEATGRYVSLVTTLTVGHCGVGPTPGAGVEEGGGQ